MLRTFGFPTGFRQIHIQNNLSGPRIQDAEVHIIRITTRSKKPTIWGEGERLDPSTPQFFAQEDLPNIGRTWNWAKEETEIIISSAKNVERQHVFPCALIMLLDCFVVNFGVFNARFLFPTRWNDVKEISPQILTNNNALFSRANT